MPSLVVEYKTTRSTLNSLATRPSFDLPLLGTLYDSSLLLHFRVLSQACPITTGLK